MRYPRLFPAEGKRRPAGAGGRGGGQHAVFSAQRLPGVLGQAGVRPGLAAQHHRLALQPNGAAGDGRDGN